jgi:hypothetical protein
VKGLAIEEPLVCPTDKSNFSCAIGSNQDDPDVFCAGTYPYYCSSWVWCNTSLLLLPFVPETNVAEASQL